MKAALSVLLFVLGHAGLALAFSFFATVGEAPVTVAQETPAPVGDAARP